jgi:putative CocE/NonD family hydrolase
MRMLNRSVVLFSAVASLLFGATLAQAADQFAVAYERNVPVKMRDGVILRADIYRPTADGKFPVLLQRTPYNKDNDVDFGFKSAARGFVVIVEDVRGRYASEGDWYTFKNEPNDGYDTVEWAAALTYSNGKVGMFGGSYVGATQMLAAIAHPPHLAGICPIVTASNYHSNWVYQGGAFEQWFDQNWTSGLAQNTFDREVANNTNALQGISIFPLADYPLFNLDKHSHPASSAALAPYYLDWLAHPDYDDYWKAISIEDHFGDINVPALHVAAWYDLFLGGSLRNYEGLKAHAATDQARRGQRLMVIVGGHAGNGPKIGDVDFGAASKIDEDEITLHWYEYLFKDAHNEFASNKRARIFVMGANQWRDEDDWPLSRARGTKYFLHSGGKANSLGGNGTLSVSVPGNKEPSDQYIYDPANPVPTVGGPLCCDSKHLAPGPHDQRAVEARDDVLVYSTPPMSQDTEITGPVTVELYAKSSAVDTDFTAKLIDVAPDGFAQNLTEGILRVRYRDSQETPSLITPGQIYKLNIDVWATSNVFKKGHILRLEISSSNFPRFARNLNTGRNRYLQASEDMNSDQLFRPATNVIYHDAEHPSALILPVVSDR